MDRRRRSLTGEGAAAREEIEATTDRAALAPWAHLGEDGCTRLRELAKPLVLAIVDGGGSGFVRR